MPEAWPRMRLGGCGVLLGICPRPRDVHVASVSPGTGCGPSGLSCSTFPQRTPLAGEYDVLDAVAFHHDRRASTAPCGAVDSTRLVNTVIAWGASMKTCLWVEG